MLSVCSYCFASVVTFTSPSLSGSIRTPSLRVSAPPSVRLGRVLDWSARHPAVVAAQTQSRSPEILKDIARLVPMRSGHSATANVTLLTPSALWLSLCVQALGDSPVQFASDAWSPASASSHLPQQLAARSAVAGDGGRREATLVAFESGYGRIFEATAGAILCRAGCDADARCHGRWPQSAMARTSHSAVHGISVNAENARRGFIPPRLSTHSCNPPALTHHCLCLVLNGNTLESAETIRFKPVAIDRSSCMRHETSNLRSNSRRKE